MVVIAHRGGGKRRAVDGSRNNIDDVSKLSANKRGQHTPLSGLEEALTGLGQVLREVSDPRGIAHDYEIEMMYPERAEPGTWLRLTTPFRKRFHVLGHQTGKAHSRSDIRVWARVTRAESQSSLSHRAC